MYDNIIRKVPHHDPLCLLIQMPHQQEIRRIEECC